MSLRYEQYNALLTTRNFLRDLLAGPRLPMKELRRRASSCLHHFPFLRESGQPMWSQDGFTEDVVDGRICPVCGKGYDQSWTGSSADTVEDAPLPMPADETGETT